MVRVSVCSVSVFISTTINVHVNIRAVWRTSVFYTARRVAVQGNYFISQLASIFTQNIRVKTGDAAFNVIPIPSVSVSTLFISLWT
jgi:hypothetical protein